MYRDFPMFAFDITSNGRVIDCSDYLLRHLQFPKDAVVGGDIGNILEEHSRTVLEDYLNASTKAPVQASEALVFRTRNGTGITTMARIGGLRKESSGALRVLAVESSSMDELLASLHDRTEILEGFMEASNEAMWCIEFTEAVDLDQNESEIVRQVFNNERHWILCNLAMAELYGVPSDVDIHDTPVSTIFPQSPANEHFVRHLIQHDFTVDRSPSIDMRHDGAVIYAENTVRGHIKGNLLHRMWGTVRDVTEFKQQQQLLSQSATQFSDILSALPDAVILVTQNRIIIAVNPAFERLLGLSADSILDRDFAEFTPFDTDDELHRRWHNGHQHRWYCETRHANGVVSACEARVAPLETQASRFVISIRPITSAYRRVARDGVMVN